MLDNIPKPVLKNQMPALASNGQIEPPPRKMLDRVRDAIRVKHYSYQTEKSYVQWIRRFILFHNKPSPCEMCGDEVKEFLTHLAMNENGHWSFKT